MSDPDRHAAEREHQARKGRYGMQVTGRSVRLLGRLIAGVKPKPAQRRKARRKGKNS